MKSYPQYSVYDSGTIKTLSYVSDSGTAVAHKLGSYNTLSTSGAKILSVYNDNFTTEKAYVDKNGDVGFAGKLFATASSFEGQFYDNRRAIYVNSTSVSSGWYSGNSNYSVDIGYSAGYQYTGTYRTNIGSCAGAYANEWSSNYGAYAGAYYQGSAKPKRICNFGYKAGYFSNEDDINIGVGPYAEIIKGNQANRILKILANLHIIDPDTLGSEVLDETDFATYTKWAPTGSVALTSNNVAVTGAGTLTQAEGDFITAVDAASWYCFEYEVTTGAASNLSKLAAITTTFASVETVLPIRDTGVFKVYFQTAAAPTDFVLEFFGSTSFVIDNFSLKKITGGSISALSADFASTTLRSVDLTNVPSGVDQATAGAAAGELWIDTDDNILRIGV